MAELEQQLVSGQIYQNSPDESLKQYTIIFTLHEDQGNVCILFPDGLAHISTPAPTMGSFQKPSPSEISRWAVGINVYVPLQTSGATFQSRPCPIRWQCYGWTWRFAAWQRVSFFADVPISVINALRTLPSQGFGVRQEVYPQ